MRISPTPPRNEVVLLYAPGSPERAQLYAALTSMEASAPHPIHQHVGGDARDGSGEVLEVKAPHRHELVLG